MTECIEEYMKTLEKQQKHAVMFEGRVLDVVPESMLSSFTMVASPHSQYTQRVSQRDSELIEGAIRQGRQVRVGIFGGWEII